MFIVLLSLCCRLIWTMVQFYMVHLNNIILKKALEEDSLEAFWIQNSGRHSIRRWNIFLLIWKSYLSDWSWQFCRIKRGHFQVIGHPAEFGWKHIPYVLHLIVESSSFCQIADFRHRISAQAPPCIRAYMCLLVRISLSAILRTVCKHVYVCIVCLKSF